MKKLTKEQLKRLAIEREKELKKNKEDSDRRNRRIPIAQA